MATQTFELSEETEFGPKNCQNKAQNQFNAFNLNQGEPERPFSQNGKKLFIKYWKIMILRYICKNLKSKRQKSTLEDLKINTGINFYDAKIVLKLLNFGCYENQIMLQNCHKEYKESTEALLQLENFSWIETDLSYIRL